MPRTLVINGRFNPYSYEDYIKPLQQSTEQHQQVEAAYGELGAAADLWADIAMNEKDSEAAAMYSKYSDDLRKQADNLAMYGLNGNSRRELFNMKRRYASEIQPIENAYNARVEDIKLQRELSAKDPSLLWNSSASSASIDSYLHGNRPDYYSVSGDDMYKRAATGAKAINDMFVNAEERTAFNNAYFDLVERKGMPPEMALQMMYNSGSFGVFDRLMDTLHEGSNYNKLQDEGKAQIDARIIEGIAAGLSYDEKHNIQRNYPYEMALQNAYSRALAREKAALSAGASAGANMVPMNTLRLQTPGTGSRRDQKKVDRVTSNPIFSALASGSDVTQRVDMRKALQKATLMNNGTLRSKTGDSRFQMFDASGNMLSRDRFVAQGADRASQNNLGKIYDDFVKDVRKAGYSDENISFGTLNSYLYDSAAANNSALSFAVELPIGTLGGGNDDVLNKIRSKTSNGMQIEEVKAFEGDRVSTTGKPLDLSKIDSKSVNFAMTYDGLLVFDGTNYGLIRPENIGSLAESSMQNLRTYKNAADKVKRAYNVAVSKGYTGGYEQFLNESPDGYQTYQGILQEYFQPAMLDMIRALNYSFSSTAINPLAKGNLVDSVTFNDEDEE